jgi:hypothetical protein
MYCTQMKLASISTDKDHGLYLWHKNKMKTTFKKIFLDLINILMYDFICYASKITVTATLLFTNALAAGSAICCLATARARSFF